MTHIALLRGINVGKTKRMAMVELRALLERIGYRDVKTLLASGNVAFTAATKDDAIQSRLEGAIKEHFGFDVTVVVRTAHELRKIVEGNPFPEAVGAGSKFHVAFLSAKPKSAAVRDIAPSAFAPEQFAVVGREIYLWCRNGFLETRLFTVFNDTRLAVAMTVRNWNTVTKLLALRADSRT